MDEGRDPLHVYPVHPSQEQISTYPPATFESGGAITGLRQAWIDACLAFDERRAETILNQAFAYYSPEDVCFDLLQKGLVEIGDGWYQGQVSVQQEHFTSALAMRRLDSLLAATPPPTRAGRILVGCPPGESHTFGPLMVTLLLRRRGWDVLYLGADVPTNRLQATIERTQPDLVIFSAQLLDTAASLLDVATYLRDIGLSLAYSGYIFGLLPELSRRIPGHFLGFDLRQTPQLVEALILNRPSVPPTEPIPAIYQQAWSYFRDRSGLIEAHIWQNLEAPAAVSGMAAANRRLTGNILSALKLGNLDFIGPNLQWLEGMMINHNMPPTVLCDFLKAYHRAAAQHLDAPSGEPVVSWLARVVAECEAATAQLAEHYWSAE
jgi:methanogenic corrinoid protein MtbC1